LIKLNYLWAIVTSKVDLTEVEINTLKRVARGEFNNLHTVPAIVDSLIRKRLVEISPSVVFPMMPQRNNYSLTILGKTILDSL